MPVGPVIWWGLVVVGLVLLVLGIIWLIRKKPVSFEPTSDALYWGMIILGGLLALVSLILAVRATSAARERSELIGRAVGDPNP